MSIFEEPLGINLVIILASILRPYVPTSQATTAIRHSVPRVNVRAPSACVWVLGLREVGRFANLGGM